jgi:hypothetical protein
MDLRRPDPSASAEIADLSDVELTQCPYDSTPIEAEALSGGSMLLTCSRCSAAWEWHGAWLRRVREPDRDAVLIAREEPRSTESTQ